MRQMEVVYNRIIPIKGFSAMNFFGKIYRRMNYKNKYLSQTTLNHEGIHSCEAEDFIPNPKNSDFKRILGYLIFYLIYIIEWIFKAICNIFYWKIRAYRSISFEIEAYNNQYDYEYQDKRKRWAWTKHIFEFVLRD